MCLEEADRVVREGGARSRNQLLTDGLRRELVARRRQAIDDSFAGMEKDSEYQTEAELLLREFASADWEAFQLADNER